MSSRSIWIVLLMWSSSTLFPTMADAQANVQMHGRGAVDLFKGTILKIEKEVLVVRDTDGHAVSLRVDQQTKMVGPLKDGDKIEVDLGPHAYAKAIRRID
jgi:hypothetical protein